MKHTVTVTLEVADDGSHYETHGEPVTATTLNTLHNAVDGGCINHGVLKPTTMRQGTQYRYVAALIGKTTAEAARPSLETVSDYATKAVVLDINWTTETGKATLYDFREDGTAICADQFTETLKENGSPCGELAASKMHVHHGIPAVATWDRIHRLSGMSWASDGD